MMVVSALYSNVDLYLVSLYFPWDFFIFSMYWFLKIWWNLGKRKRLCRVCCDWRWFHRQINEELIKANIVSLPFCFIGKSRPIMHFRVLLYWMYPLPWYVFSSQLHSCMPWATGPLFHVSIPCITWWTTIRDKPKSIMNHLSKEN